MGCCSQSSPSQHTQAEAEQHQSRVFLAVQWLQTKHSRGRFMAFTIQFAAIYLKIEQSAFLHFTLELYLFQRQLDFKFHRQTG